MINTIVFTCGLNADGAKPPTAKPATENNSTYIV